jgi:hydrogenase maturation protease
MSRILVAGIGNIFLGDDGFGVAVVERLRRDSLGPEVDVADFGIRGIHLAYELADGKYATAVLVDAVARGGAPGTLYTIEAEPDDEVGADLPDAHNLTPALVIAWIRRLGASCRVLVVGCEPATLEETMTLSPAVAASIEGAAQMIRDIVAHHAETPARGSRAEHGAPAGDRAGVRGGVEQCA